MFSNPGLMIRVAPLLASLALVFSCCYLYDIPTPTPTPVPTATPACTMHFTHPADGAALPLGSEVDFSWTSVAKASYYIFSLSGPGSGGNPNNTNTQKTSWPVYTDSIGGLGSYTAAVQTRDADANILCQAQIHFTVVPAPTATKTRTPTPLPPTPTKAPKQHKAPQPTKTPTPNVPK